MKINHLNLAVTDVDATRDFLIQYFGLRPVEGAPQNKGFGFLFDDDQTVLTLMKAKRDDAGYPANFHIGFIQATEAKVDEINARLRADGYEVPPPARLHGSWTFYFTCPGGFTIEVLA
jgi:catechol 2,3-dioxygenase-like lactoylglutathione lyase family enzyme